MKEKIKSERILAPQLQGANKHCIVCQYGLQDIVERETLKGTPWQEIKRILKRERPFYYQASGIKRENIKSHVFSDHCKINNGTIKVARKANRDMRLEKKTIQEVQEDFLAYMGTALNVVNTIEQEDIDSLGVKDKFKIMNEGAKILQKSQDIAIKARAQNLNENKWLQELNAIAAGTSGNELIEVQEDSNLLENN